MPMKLREFECLRAIITTGNMTRAAASIGISQPSASSILANLEHELGFKLFERVKGRLVATVEAKHFMPEVTRTLDSMDLARQKAKQIKDNKFGDLKIASYPDIAIDFLPGVISRFLDGNREVQVRLHARRSEMMSGLLPAQEFDMAIVTSLVESRNFDVEEFQLPCVLAFSDGFDLHDGASLRPADIADLPIVSLSADHPTTKQLVEKFADTKTLYPERLIETQTFESAASFIRRKVGVGLLDPVTASRYVGKDIIVRPFEPAVYQSIYLLIPADRPVSRMFDLFRKQLIADLEDCNQRCQLYSKDMAKKQIGAAGK